MSTNEPPAYPGDSTPPPVGGNQPPASGSFPPAGGYPPPGGYPPAPGGYGQAGPPKTNQKATASMVVGIASLVLGLFCGFLVIGSVVAIVLGFIARGEIIRSNGTQKGMGQALTGIITGFVLVALFLLAVVLLATGVVDYDFNVEG
ncbi:DUF4190 domain-containing protein [Aeromicrobium wangtongii]|uniref:DUF4190 domain-containing protein n=1 Tax=Aeromicrobium wangtongii TaxID=2969247 RepID=UPI002017ED7C|nr:DUF4190 domain-containing protein [Aeromicrobium wangtongii]MCL3818503.1 DUF4190 domain-containing protein [Aeromicrobium wangtongii]